MADEDQTDLYSGALLAQLKGLLNMLEGAGGGPDPEARQALQRLQMQLLALEAAKAGAVAPPEASVPQQLEVLQVRVAAFETRMEALPADTIEIINEAASPWIHAQLDPPAGDAQQLEEGGRVGEGTGSALETHKDRENLAVAAEQNGSGGDGELIDLDSLNIQENGGKSS